MESNQIRALVGRLSLWVWLALSVAAVCLAAPSVCAGAEVRLKLSRISPYGGVELSGPEARLAVAIPVPNRWDVTSARLSLSYTNSSALLAERSRMVVSLNDFVVGQRDLRPDAPEGRWDLDLPAALLPPDYNALEFRIIQNYTYECADPVAPELWTRLNLDDSWIELEYAPRPVPPRLSALPELVFDPKRPGRADVHLVIPEKTDEYAGLAVLVGAGVAIRYEYRPVNLTVSDRIAPGRDNVFMGDRAALAGLLGDETEPPAGSLAVMALPGPGGPDPDHVLVAVAADSAGERRTAAMALAVLSYPWPDAPSATPQAVRPPDVTRYSGRGLLEPDHTYFFRELGLDTTGRKGVNPGPIKLDFRLPADAVSPTNAPLSIRLNLAHGAGMKPESALNVSINDVFVTAIALRDDQGAFYQDYRLNVPTRYLHPGANTITFDPVLTPVQDKPCEFTATENLTLTVFGDSTLSLPPMEHWAALPALDLFAHSGYPFSRWPDWRTTTLAVAGDDWTSLAAALNLTAAFCQKTGVPPFEIQVTVDPPDRPAGDLLLVGPWSDWPEKWRNASPLSRDFAYPFHGRTPALKKLKKWWLRFFPETARRRSMGKESAEIEFAEALGAGRPTLVEFEAPGGDGRTVVGLTGQSAFEIRAAAQALWDPALQGQISGQIALLDLNQDRPAAVARPARDRYYVGSLTTLTLLEQVTRKYPKVFFGVLIVLLVATAWLILKLLRRLKHKRLRKDQSHDRMDA